MKYYNRAGEEIPFIDWVESFNHPENKNIARTKLEDGTLISTVWLGLDHSFGMGPIPIFETMVFRWREIALNIQRFVRGEKLVNVVHPVSR